MYAGLHRRFKMTIVKKQIRIIKKLIPKLQHFQQSEVIMLWRDCEAHNEDLSIVINRCYDFIEHNNRLLKGRL